MALNFGKINRSAAFNPTTAFPLDARCYFENYELAELAAKSARPAGDTTTTYYHGLPIVVVENNEAIQYLIQPDGSLAKSGGGEKTKINDKAFEFDSTGQLNLKGFNGAEVGYQPIIGADGQLTWIKPSSTSVEGLTVIVETLTERVDIVEENLLNLVNTVSEKANSADVYTKNEIKSIIGDTQGKTLVQIIEETKSTTTTEITEIKETTNALNEAITKLNGDVNTDGSVLAMIAANAPSVASVESLGLVKSSPINVENSINIATDGSMSVNSLNVNKLTQTEGEYLVLNGGDADFNI